MGRGRVLRTRIRPRHSWRTNECGNFTLLPGALPAEADDAAIVACADAARCAWCAGPAVNEERAGEWIQVDLLVGDDGLPQAVRLPQQ